MRGGYDEGGESGDRKESTVQELLCVTDDAHRFPLAFPVGRALFIVNKNGRCAHPFCCYMKFIESVKATTRHELGEIRTITGGLGRFIDARLLTEFVKWQCRIQVTSAVEIPVHETVEKITDIKSGRFADGPCRTGLVQNLVQLCATGIPNSPVCSSLCLCKHRCSGLYPWAVNRRVVGSSPT